jgi:hypothetical protein
MSDERDAVSDSDEPGAPVAVHHGLIRLQDASSTKLHLQELRAGDRV